MLTTKQAAERLGVSSRRVLALVEAGDLAAERFGRSWMIDERSVEERARAPRLAGRPKLGQKHLLSLKPYTLMNRNHAVFDFVYDDERKRVSIERVREGAAWAPIGAGLAGGGKPNGEDFAAWLRRRYMPPLRPEAARLMRAAGVSSTDALMFGSFGLNLSDQYWFKPEGADLDWHDVNFFENGYECVESGLFRTPDSSTPGVLEKRWERIDGIDCLIKGSSSSDEREPYNEALATRLFQRLLDEGEYVPYEIVERGGRTCSSCPTFVTAETEFVPAADVAVCAGITEGRDFYRGYARVLRRQGHRGRADESCEDDRVRPRHWRTSTGIAATSGWCARSRRSTDGAWRRCSTTGRLLLPVPRCASSNRHRFVWTAKPVRGIPLAAACAREGSELVRSAYARRLRRRGARGARPEPFASRGVRRACRPPRPAQHRRRGRRRRRAQRRLGRVRAKGRRLLSKGPSRPAMRSRTAAAGRGRRERLAP